MAKTWMRNSGSYGIIGGGLISGMDLCMPIFLAETSDNFFAKENFIWKF